MVLGSSSTPFGFRFITGDPLPSAPTLLVPVAPPETLRFLAELLITISMSPDFVGYSVGASTSLECVAGRNIGGGGLDETEDVPSRGGLEPMLGVNLEGSRERSCRPLSCLAGEEEGIWLPSGDL